MPLFKKKIQAATDFVKASGDIIDNVVTNQQERGQLKNSFTQLLTSMEQFYEENVTERHISDNKEGNWLTRSVRPVIALLLVIACIIFVVMGYEGDQVNKMFDFTKTAVISYFGLREFGKTLLPVVSDYTKKLRRKG